MTRQKSRDKKKSDSAPAPPPYAADWLPGGAEAIAQALRESEARYRRLLDAVTDYAYAVRICQGEPVATEHGSGCISVTGYCPEDFQSDPFLWIKMVHPDDREAVLKHARDVLRRDAEPLEHRILHRDGSTRWVRSTIIRHVEGETLVRYDGILRDVTERRRLQDSLRQSSTFLQTVLDAIPEVTLVVDAQRRIILANRAAQSLARERAPLVEEMTCSALFYPGCPNCHQEAGCPVSQVLATKSPAMVTRGFRSPDGAQMVMEVSAAPIVSGGEVSAVVMSCRDITTRRRIEQALHETELQLLTAQRIQEHLLPKHAPELAGLDIAGALYPAEFAAGDYYDYLPMAGDCLGLVIGDVTGHGFSSALIMSLTQVLIRMLVEAHDEIPQVLRHANSVLCRATSEYHFVTLFCGRIDTGRRELVYASAGHPPGYLIGRDGEVKRWLESTSHPLGMFPDISFPTSDPIHLESGDILVLVTDGIEEARKPNGELFGRQRLIDVVRRHRQRSAQEIARRLCRTAREFAGRITPEDDTTAVIVRVLE